ncbi:MAG TPA: GNAT family N-acetyltransferase [Candidatus Nanopelagicales bacterium]
MSDITVADNPDRMRYELRTADGEVAGSATYARRGRSVVIDHTTIRDAYEGRGYGSALARGALDDIRARGLQVVPVCEFLAGWIDRNPDYADLVDTALAEEYAAAAGGPPS